MFVVADTPPTPADIADVLKAILFFFSGQSVAAVLSSSSTVGMPPGGGDGLLPVGEISSGGVWNTVKPEKQEDSATGGGDARMQQDSGEKRAYINSFRPC